MKQLLKTTFLLFLLGSLNLAEAAEFSLEKRSFNFNSEKKFEFGNEKPAGPLNTKSPFSWAMPSPNADDYGMGFNAGFISLALPGVGLYMANKALISLAFLPICYGMVGGGSLKMMKTKKEAEDAYASYMIEKNPALQDDYIELADDAKERNAQGKSLLIGGVAIWIGQAAWTFIYGSYNDKYRARDAKWNNKVSLFPSGGYDFRTNTATLNLSLKF